MPIDEKLVSFFLPLQIQGLLYSICQVFIEVYQDLIYYLVSSVERDEDDWVLTGYKVVEDMSIKEHMPAWEVEEKLVSLSLIE